MKKKKWNKDDLRVGQVWVMNIIKKFDDTNKESTKEYNKVTIKFVGEDSIEFLIDDDYHNKIDSIDKFLGSIKDFYSEKKTFKSGLIDFINKIINFSFKKP